MSRGNGWASQLKGTQNWGSSMYQIRSAGGELGKREGKRNPLRQKLNAGISAKTRGWGKCHNNVDAISKQQDLTILQRGKKKTAGMKRLRY